MNIQSYLKYFLFAFLVSALFSSCQNDEIVLEPLAQLNVTVPQTKSQGVLPQSFEAMVTVIVDNKEKRGHTIRFTQMDEHLPNYRAGGSFEIPVNTPVIVRVNVDIAGRAWKGESEQVILKKDRAPYLITIDLREEASIIIGSGVTDVDGNEYNTVIIGAQEWMAENLRVTSFRFGEEIMLADQNQMWSEAGNTNQPAYVWYNNNEAHQAVHGALYNWYAVQTGNLCPEGWVVPTDQHWQILQNTVGSAAGRKLKSEQGWHAGGNGVDIFGFNAKPSGYRHFNGEFGGLTRQTFWWSSTQATQASAWARGITDSGSPMYRYSYGKEDGFSVRCMREVILPSIWLEEEIWDITESGAALFGFVDDRDAEVFEVGVVWSIQQNPSLENNQGQLLADEWFHEVLFELEGLESRVIYFARAYMQTDQGLFYSNQVSFETL